MRWTRSYGVLAILVKYVQYSRKILTAWSGQTRYTASLQGRILLFRSCVSRKRKPLGEYEGWSSSHIVWNLKALKYYIKHSWWIFLQTISLKLRHPSPAPSSTVKHSNILTAINQNSSVSFGANRCACDRCINEILTMTWGIWVRIVLFYGFALCRYYEET